MVQFGLWFVCILGLVLSESVVLSHKTGHRKRHDDKRWVDIWASMPQLTEVLNLPPVPFVSPYFQIYNIVLIRF